MQDKRIHIDEQFTDHAWTEMSKVLDQEMPVSLKNRHRRIAWWWFAMACLLVSTSVAGFVIFGKKKTTTVANSTPPVAGAMLSPVSKNEISKSVIAPSPLSISSLTPKIEKVQPIQKQAVPKTHPSKEVSILSQKGKSASKASVKAPSILGKVTDDALLKITATEQVEASINEHLPSKESQNETVILATTPPLLKLLSSKYLTHEQLFSPSCNSKFENFTFNRWRMAIQGTGIVSLNSEASGVSMILIAAKPLKNSRLSFETGIGYSFIQQPLKVVVNNYYQQTGPVTIDSLELIAYGTNADILKSSPTNAASYAQTKYWQGLNLHYLSVPLQLSYRFGYRFNVKAGLEGHLLISANSKFVSGGIVSWPNQANDESITSHQDSKVTNFDISATGTIGFQLLPKLSVFANYKFGIIDVLPRNNIKDFNRLLHLGIRYNLKGKN